MILGRTAARGPSLGELLLAALAAAPFFIDYTGSLNDPADLPQRVFAAAAVAGIAAWCAGRAARGAAAEILLTRWHLALACFLAWCGLTGLWSRSGLEWWLEWRHWLLAGAAGAAAAAAGGRAAPWSRAAFFASAATTALLALFQYFEVRPFSLVLQSVPPGATFGHRSFAMHWLVLGMPVGVGLWARETDSRRRWALALGLGLIVGVGLLASARAAWFAGAFEALLLGAWLASEGRRGSLPGPAGPRWQSAAGGLALAFLIAAAERSGYAAAYGGYSQRMSAVVTGLSGAPTSAVEGAAIPVNNVRMRLAIWRNSAAIVAKRPWRGVGLGNFQVHYPWFSRSVQDDGVNRESLVVDHAHNDPLEVLIETGAVGLLLALATGGAALWAGGRLLRSAELEDRASAAGFSVAALGLLVNSLFCLPAHRALPPIAAAVFLGLLAGRAGGRTIRVPVRATAAGAALFTAACALLTLFGARSLAASWFYGRVHGSLNVLEQNRLPPPAVSKEEWARRQAAVLLAAKEDAEAAAALDTRPNHLYTLGAINSLMGRYDAALGVLVPFTERRPNHFRALVILSLALKEKGRLDEALQVAGRAVNIRPESARAQHALAAVQAAVSASKALPASGVPRSHE